MKIKSLAILSAVLLVSNGNYLSSAQDLQASANAISQKIADAGRKTVAVVDFTNLCGSPTVLGRFLAEEFSDELFSAAKGFSVIDRTHLKAIMQEHKLGTTGLIDPSTARKLGQITGAETLVTGTLTPFEENVRLALKVLDSETAKIVAASTTNVPKTKTISDLIGVDESSCSTSRTTPQLSAATPDVQRQTVPPGSVSRDGFSFSSKGCKVLVNNLTCTFSVMNSANEKRRAFFSGSVLIDDQGNQYHPAEFFGGSQGTIEVYPGIPINLVLEVRNIPDSTGVMSASLHYGIWTRPENFNPDLGQVLIRLIPIQRP